MIRNVQIVQFKNGMYGVRRGHGVPVLSPYQYTPLDGGKASRVTWHAQADMEFNRCASKEFWPAATTYERVSGRNLITRYADLGAGDVVDIPIKVAELRLSGEPVKSSSVFDEPTTLGVLLETKKQNVKFSKEW
jgi:hypothetical protein